MKNKALVVIDLQNDITKNYQKIIGQVNAAIDWAVVNEMHVIYIKHYNLSEKTRTFKPDTKGSELVPELKVVSENVFEKSKASALTSEAFAEFIEENGVEEFYITGADATACVKSTSYNLARVGYTVHVISDCVTSYNLKKMDEMLKYYADKGCEVLTLKERMREKEYVIEIKDVLMDYIKSIEPKYRLQLLEIMESGLQYEKTRSNMKDTVIEKVEKVFEDEDH